MNATEDETEPLGESPAIDTTAPKYQPVHPVTYYQARCTSCGVIATDYGDFGALSDGGTAIEYARDYCDWFERVREEAAPTPENPRRRIAHTVELLCKACQRCEVCGSDRAYVIDDEHLVCADHEGHEFEGGA